MQSLKKKWLVVSNKTWGICWIFTQPHKNLKISFWWAVFVERVKGLSNKIQRNYLSWHWKVMQNLNKPWPWGFKNGMRNWKSTQNERVLKSMKNYTLIGSFCPKYIMVYNVSARKFHRNCASWYWRVTQNLRENWLVAWQIT